MFIKRTQLARLATAAVAAGALVAAPAASAQSAGACRLDGRSVFDSPMRTLPQSLSFSFLGELTNCTTTDGAPATGRLQAGGDYVVGGVTYRLPQITGEGGCAASAVSGIAVADWADGTRTVVSFEERTVGASGVLVVRSLDSVQVPRVGGGTPLTLATTRYAGHSSVGAVAFDAPVAECVTGMDDSLVHGAIALVPVA